MADYSTPTVVQPSIPAPAITPIEMDLLAEMFECEPDGAAIYFFASKGVIDTITLDVETLKASLAIASDTPSSAADFVRKALEEAAPDDGGEIELDVSDLKEGIFQDIIRRCDQLDHVTITTAWTCSKMRADGFGGSVTVITADKVLWSNTSEMEGELLDRAEFGELGCVPGQGSHVLLRLDEQQVRRTIEIITKHQELQGISPGDVTDADIRDAALAVVAASDLSDELSRIAINAAKAAIDLAAARHETAQE